MTFKQTLKRNFRLERDDVLGTIGIVITIGLLYFLLS